MTVLQKRTMAKAIRSSPDFTGPSRSHGPGFLFTRRRASTGAQPGARRLQTGHPPSASSNLAKSEFALRWFGAKMTHNRGHHQFLRPLGIAGTRSRYQP